MVVAQEVFVTSFGEFPLEAFPKDIADVVRAAHLKADGTFDRRFAAYRAWLEIERLAEKMWNERKTSG